MKKIMIILIYITLAIAVKSEEKNNFKNEKIAWGKTVNGLQIGIVIRKQKNADYEVDYYVKNTSSKDIRLHGAGYEAYWKLLFIKEDDKQIFRAIDSDWALEDIDSDDIVLSPTKIKLAANFKIEKDWFFSKDLSYDDYPDDKIKKLSPGEYSIKCTHSSDWKDKTKKYWNGEVSSSIIKSVIEIK